jgi:hypothetical protein
MANETTFSIKFDGYEKTFKNINELVGGLADMKQELSDLEEQFSSAEFGSQEWDDLNKQIEKTNNSIKEFEKQVSESSAITNAAIQKTLKLQEESIKQSEETAKAFEEAFSPEAIIEFSAKASAAFIGLSEAFGGTGGAAEKSIERIQKALITVNAIKDSAEVAVLSFKKFKTGLDSWSDSLAKGGKSATLLGKGVDLLGKGLKSPLVILTAIIGVVTALTSAFGNLANVINFVSDSVAGLVSGFKALISFENPLTAFNNEFERLGKQRGLEQRLDSLNEQIRINLTSFEKLNQQLALSNSFGEKRKLTNEIFEKTNDQLNDQLDILRKLIKVETDKTKLAELDLEFQNKRVEIIQLQTQNILENRQITLDSINSITDAQTIQNATKIRLLEQELLFNTANAKRSEELVNKSVEADTKAAKFKIANLETLSFLDESLINEIAALKEEVASKELAGLNRIRAIKLNAAELDRQLLQATQQIQLQLNEKELEFIDIRTQKGIEEAEKLIRFNQAAKEKEIQISLEALNKIGKLTDEEEIRKITLLNELTQLKIDADQKVLEVSLENLALLAEAQNNELDLREKQLQKVFDLSEANSKEEQRLLNLSIQQNEKRLNQVRNIFNIGKIYKDIIADTNKIYDDNLKQLEDNRNLQLKNLEIEKKRLEIQINQLEQTENLTAAQKQQLELLKAELKLLDGQEVKIKLDFQTGVGENEAERKAAIDAKKKEAVQAEIETGLAVAQGLADVSQIIINQQLENLQQRLDVINQAKQKIDEQISLLQSKLEATQNEIDTINTQLETAKGSERDFLQNALSQELESRAKIEQSIQREAAAKKQLALDEEKIRQQQIKAQRLAIQVQSVLTLAQAAGAVASAAAVSNVSAPIIIPLVVAALAAGFAAVKSFAKFERGGLLKGNSHAQGGIKGSGAFNNIEVEGGEFIVNKRATMQNLPFLQKINQTFEAGGTLGKPTTQMFNEGVQSEINKNNLVEAFKSVNLQIGVVDVVEGIDRVNKINLMNSI